MARYDLYNPLLSCGFFGHPEANTDGIRRHTKVFDLQDCIEPGRAVQAIRLDPQSGTVGLKRMKVTLEGARW